MAYQPAFSFGSRQEEKVRKDTPDECDFCTHLARPKNGLFANEIG